jgi:deoxyribonuclease-2
MKLFTTLQCLCFLLLVLINIRASVSSVSAATSSPTCIDENGQSVDWYIILKTPEISSSYPSVSKGYAYLYADSNSYTTKRFFTNSSHSLGDGQGALDHTLAQIYSNYNNVGYAFYNDETPSGSTSYSYGHTKGVMGWDNNGGFWLIHSVPKMAEDPSKGSFSYPNNGRMYGQSMICVSLNATNMDSAFFQLTYTNPQLYANSWISGTESIYPNGNQFFNQKVVVKKAGTNIATIVTKNGVSFTHYAKNVKWGKCIFGDLIGPQYSVSTLVESWQDPYEKPYLPPTVTLSVYSSLLIATPNYAQWDSISWKQAIDHSKWSVSIGDNGAAAVTCIGDINKQTSQNHRSGGMLCIQDKVIYNAFVDLIVTTDMN